MWWNILLTPCYFDQATVQLDPTFTWPVADGGLTHWLTLSDHFSHKQTRIRGLRPASSLILPSTPTPATSGIQRWCVLLVNLIHRWKFGYKKPHQFNAKIRMFLVQKSHGFQKMEVWNVKIERLVKLVTSIRIFQLNFCFDSFLCDLQHLLWSPIKMRVFFIKMRAAFPASILPRAMK